jgi:hypothetical protein
MIADVVVEFIEGTRICDITATRAVTLITALSTAAELQKRPAQRLRSGEWPH